MDSLVISGGQWGDEGKAKITDLLSQKADYIIRYQGGANAGHTVSVNDKSYKFHLIPSGILSPDKICIIGPGAVINPDALLSEINNLLEQNISLNNLYISGLAHVSMPWHIAIDQSADKIGSTGKGIGPTYADKTKRVGICLYDLLNKESLFDKLSKILPYQNEVLKKIYNLPEYKLEDVLNQYLEYGKLFKQYIKDTVNELAQANKNKKKIIYEGAQGALLDITYGTYPYVTSSNPIAGGACIGAGVGPTKIQYSLGVFKAFITRVGKGPFVSELDDNSEYANMLCQQNTAWAEYGTTTGRKRRTGWFDAVIARYSININSYEGIALTKLDTLDQFDKFYICNAYRHKDTGELIENIAYLDSYYLEQYEPVLTEINGWYGEITYKTTEYSKLPQNAKKYIKHLENILDIPVDIISTGPNREDSIYQNVNLL